VYHGEDGHEKGVLARTFASTIELGARFVVAEESIEDGADDVVAVSTANEKCSEATAGDGRVEVAVGAKLGTTECQGGGGFVEVGFVDRLADRLPIDAFEAELLFEETPAARLVGFAVLNPVTGERFVVEVAPVFESGDGGVDRLRRKSLVLEAIADLTFGTRAAREQVHGGIDGLGPFVEDAQTLDLRLVEVIADAETFLSSDQRREPEGEGAVEEDANPVRIALL
jgi:hypothetical protein